MQKNLKLIPIWLWVAVIIIMVFLFSSCRGGRSLGKGSAGTVIIPQTPQQINERNRQPPQKITKPPTPPVVAPPVIITPPVVKLPPTPPVKLTPSKTRPTPTTNSSAKANPVIINPKPAGKPKPFSPSVSPTPIITTPEKNLPTDNETTDGEIVLDPRESAGKKSSWWNLIYYWLFAILMIVFGWIAYDTVKPLHSKFLKENKPKKPTKKPAKATRASRKKALSKKNEKPKQ